MKELDAIKQALAAGPTLESWWIAVNPTAMQAIIAHIEAQDAEIKRLQAESDERLKNTVAQAMEIERLRAQRGEPPMRIETVNISIGAGPSSLSRAFIEALLRTPPGDPTDPPPDAPMETTQGIVPKIGEAWPAYGGIYAGISRGEDGQADAHLVLLDAATEDAMTWADAVKWAEGLGDGARLPTRLESALLYANLRDKLDTDNPTPGWLPYEARPVYVYAEAQPATAPEPSWQDAPTCVGLWFCDEGDENPYRFTCHNVSIPLNPYLVGEGERWYGPIPPDGDKP